MKKNDQKEALAERIYTLEFQQRNDLRHLKNQFHITYQSLKPVSFIKGTLKNTQNKVPLRYTLPLEPH